MPRTASTENTQWIRQPKRRVSQPREQSPVAPILLRLPMVQGPANDGAAISLPDLSETPIAAIAPAVLKPPAPPVETREQAAPLSPTLESTTAAKTQAIQAPRRTWWEHWSSGVVLILLIIALVTASIIALNDGSSNTPDQLAQDATENSLDEFDLSNVRVPDITLPPVGLTSAGESGFAPAAVLSAGEPAASSVSPLELATANELSFEAPAPTTVTATPTKQTAVAPTPEASTLVENVLPARELTLGSLDIPTNALPKEPAKGGQAEALSAPVAPQVTLSQPLGVQAPQLFDPPTSPKEASVRTPALTASGPAAQPTVPSGSSPTFYDGAAAPRQYSVTVDAQTAASADTNMPSLSAVFSSAASASAGQPTFTTASHMQASAHDQGQPLAGTSAVLATPTAGMAQVNAEVTSNGSAITATATPEANVDAIIRAYMQMAEINKAQNALPTNRFPNATPGGNGFTLGVPQ